MLDHPDKTTKLLAALKAAVPFEVELTEWLVKQLRAQHHAGADQKHHTVSDLSYAGDQGGIVCHIVPPEKQEVLVVSLTQVHVPRAMPLAAAIADYQKHRVKKLKKQDGPRMLVRLSARPGVLMITIGDFPDQHDRYQILDIGQLRYTL